MLGTTVNHLEGGNFTRSLPCRARPAVLQTGGMEQGKKTVISVLREALH